MKRTFKIVFYQRVVQRSHCTDECFVYGNLDHIHLESVQILRQVIVRELFINQAL